MNAYIIIYMYNALEKLDFILKTSFKDFVIATSHVKLLKM